MMSSIDLANSTLKPSTRSLQTTEKHISDIIHVAKTSPLTIMSVLGVLSSTTLTTTASISSTATFGNMDGCGRTPNITHARIVRISVACNRYIENEILPRKTRCRFERRYRNVVENNIEKISKKAPIVQYTRFNSSDISNVQKAGIQPGNNRIPTSYNPVDHTAFSGPSSGHEPRNSAKMARTSGQIARTDVFGSVGFSRTSDKSASKAPVKKQTPVIGGSGFAKEKVVRISKVTRRQKVVKPDVAINVRYRNIEPSSSGRMVHWFPSYAFEPAVHVLIYIQRGQCGDVRIDERMKRWQEQLQGYKLRSH